jgi:hypothetical protein
VRWQRKKAPLDDEITVPGLVIGLLVLGAGALAFSVVPLLTAITRIGHAGTALFVLGIVVLSVAFLPAYERLKPSFPPTPRRDLVVILFFALLIGLWTFAYTNEVVAILVLAGLGAIVLLPDDWRRRVAEHLPRR